MLLNSDQELNNCWQLQDAKAHFSEVVRRAQNSGPQHVTVHGRQLYSHNPITLGLKESVLESS